MTTREWRYGFYFGDRWQVHPDVTLDLGVRYEYFPLVTRADGRGVERLDIDTMKVLLGGVGDVPRNVGLKTRKTDFAPRLGIAWRVNDAHRRCAPDTASPTTRCRSPGRCAAPIR